MFQASYKITCITLTEAILVLYCRQIWTCFCLLVYFHRNDSKEPWTKILLELSGLELSRIFQRNIWRSFVCSFMPKQLHVCFVYSKNLKFYGRSYLPKVKYIKNISRNYGINYIYWDNIGDFIAKFENVFVCWDNFGSHHPEITSQNFENCQEKYLRRSSVIVMP